MADTQLTDLNLTTSVARYLAEKFTGAGWAIYWQATDVMSGTATNGEVTLVPEFPSEPSMLVLPPRDARTSTEVLLPAFSVQLISEPSEVSRAGLGQDLFEQFASFAIEGFAVNQEQHMAFATVFRNWFREDTRLLIYDYENDPVDPSLIDVDVIVERRLVDRLYTLDQNAPRQLRYFLSTQVDVSFFD